MISLSRRVTLGQLAMIILAVVYVIGYMVTRTFLATLGLVSHSIFKAEYLEVGFVFLIISIALLATPIIVKLLLDKLTEDEWKEIDDKAVAPNTKLAVSLVSNFVYGLLFICLFVVREDLTRHIHVLGWPVSLGLILSVYFYGITLLLITLAIIRWMIKESNGVLTIRVLKIVRLLLLVITILLLAIFDYVVVFEMPIWRSAVLNSIPFTILLLLVVVVIWYCKKRTDQMQEDKSRQIALISISAVFVLMLVFMSVLLYGWMMYPNIPANRGGRYPLTEIRLVLTPEAAAYYNDLLDPEAEIPNETISLFVVDVSESTLFATRPVKPFEKRYPTIIVVKRDNVARARVYRNHLLGGYGNSKGQQLGAVDRQSAALLGGN